MINLKRAYEKASRQDGIRILVDHIWPQGVSKEVAHLDLWLKDISPSDKLREWFEHDTKRWDEFKKRYFAELHAQKNVIGHEPDQWEHFKKKYLKNFDKHPDILHHLKALSKQHTITFVYADHDEQHNNAVALKEYVEHKVK